MEIGSRIRFYRIQKNMTQEELARGIISVSYLSKIENNQTSASIEVLEMLCDRLGIKLIEEEEIPLLKKLKDWYFFTVEQNKEKASEEYLFLKNSIKGTNDTKALVYFVLFELRYFIFSRNFEDATAQIHRINEYKDIFDNKMNYYFHKFYGFYLYFKNNFKAAIDNFKISEKILNKSIHFEKWEEADLYYAIGLTYSQLMKVALSINYTEKALEIYQALYHLKRSAECQVLLGISYRRLEEFQKAEESLLLAQKIADVLDNGYLKGIIHHNLGDLYEIQNKTLEAIEEYKKSLIYKENEDTISKLRTIHSIISGYYKLHDYENYRKWLNIGFSLNGESDNKGEYFIHLNIYNKLLNNSLKELEDYLKNEALPYFLEIDRTTYIIKYAELLGDYYRDNSKYKNASEYYNLALQASKRQIYIN